MPLFYERAVKRKIIPTVPAHPLCGSQPHDTPESSSRPATTPTLLLPPAALWRSAVATRGRASIGVPTSVLSETPTPTVFAYCSLRSVPGGIQLCFVLR